MDAPGVTLEVGCRSGTPWRGRGARSPTFEVLEASHTAPRPPISPVEAATDLSHLALALLACAAPACEAPSLKRSDVDFELPSL